MDPQDAITSWGNDGFFYTEAARGGPMVWRVGGARLEGDGLGPVRHAHDGAPEYYFMFSGAAHVETGSERFVLEEGQLGLIPPDAPHNFLGPTGDDDACLFCLVAPNRVESKWRVRDFADGSESLRMQVATPFVDPVLPGDDHVTAHALALSAADEELELTPHGFEVVYLILEGAVTLSVAPGLSGTLRGGTYVHVREGMAHRLKASEPARVLRMDARFKAVHGAAPARDGG